MILHFMTLELKNNSKITLYIFYLKSNIGCIVTDSPSTSTPPSIIPLKNTFFAYLFKITRVHMFSVLRLL